MCRMHRAMPSTIRSPGRLSSSIAIHARRWMRPVSRELRSRSHFFQPYFARSAACARAITAGSVAILAVASRHGPVTVPRMSHGAMRACDEPRSRFTLPESPAVKTYSVPSTAANHTGVATSAPLPR